MHRNQLSSSHLRVAFSHKIMGRYLLYTLLSSLLLPYVPTLSKSPLPSGEYTIEEITVVDTEGNPLPEPMVSLILETLNIPLGTSIAIPNDHFEETLRKLWEHGYVIAINAKKIKERSLGLQVVLRTLYPKIDSIQCTGLSSQEEKDVLSRLHCAEGKPWYPHLRERKEVSLEQHYRAQGYHHVEATITTVPSTSHRVHLHIHVKKKEQYRIGYIHFNLPQGLDQGDTYALAQHIRYSQQGILPHDNAWYKRLVRDVQRGYFTNLFATLRRLTQFRYPIFTEAKVQEDAKSLEKYYRAHGFLDAKVHYELHEEGSHINVTFDVDPGEAYSIADIQWTGNILLTEEAINKGLNLYPDKRYRPTEIVQAITPSHAHTTIHTLYKKAKHPVWVYATLQVKGIDDHQVYLQGYVQEWPYPTIQQLSVHTTGKINPKILTTILEEHGIAEGERLTQDGLILAKQGLAATGYFYPHTLSIDPSPVGPHQVKVDVYAIECQSIDFSVGLEDSKFKLSLQENNFALGKLLRLQKPLGGGQSLSTEIGFDDFSSLHVGGAFTYPWLRIFGRRTPISFHGLRKYEQGKLSDFQCSLYVSRPYHKPYLYYYAQALSLSRHTLKPPYAPIPSIDVWTWEYFNYQQDRTNHPFYPTQGSQLHTQLKVRGLLHDYTPWNRLYSQGLVQYKGFYTLRSFPITLHGSFTLGSSFYGQSASNPLNKIILADTPLALPSSGLVEPLLLPFRGYEDVPKPSDAHPYNGFHHALASSLEVRYCLFERPLIYALFFLDTAFTDRDHYMRVGTEIRILTPICILSGYMVYPSPTGGLGFRIRFMPLRGSI